MINFSVESPSGTISKHETFDAAVRSLCESWDGRNPQHWYVFDIEFETCFFVDGIMTLKTSNWVLRWTHPCMYNDDHDWMKEGF